MGLKYLNILQFDDGQGSMASQEKLLLFQKLLMIDILMKLNNKDLLELLFKENLLKTNEGDSVITIYVRYWYDGSSLGSLPMVKMISNFMWDPEIFVIPPPEKDNRERIVQKVCKSHKILMWPGPEKRLTMETIGKHVAQQWLKFGCTMKLGNNTYQFRPCIQIADIKGSQSMCGSQCGGYHGCPTCEIHRIDLHSMIIGLNTNVRSIQSTNLDAASQRVGQKGLPIWLCGLPDSQRDEFLKIYKNCELGLDTLHIIEGHSDLLFTQLSTFFIFL